LALQKHEDLPNVPLIMDLPTTPEKQGSAKADCLAPIHCAALCSPARNPGRSFGGVARLDSMPP